MGAGFRWAIVFVVACGLTSIASAGEEATPPEWIRGRLLDHRGLQHYVWVNPVRQVWAFRTSESASFYDASARAQFTYEFRVPKAPNPVPMAFLGELPFPAPAQPVGGEKIYKTYIGDATLEKVLPLASLTEDRPIITSCLLGNEPVAQKQRRTVTVEGKELIEYEFSLPRYGNVSGRLRVDPVTKLPVAWIKGPFYVAKDVLQTEDWAFELMAEGPEDIYDLGVPKFAQIVDQMPPLEVLKIFQEMADSRARLGDCSIGLAFDDSARFLAYEECLIRRRGTSWRVDLTKRLNGEVAEAAWKQKDWWPFSQETLERPHPLVTCDGATVWRIRGLAPDGTEIREALQHSPDVFLAKQVVELNTLMDRWAIFQDVYPIPRTYGHCKFEVNDNLPDQPGIVLLKVSEGRIGVSSVIPGESFRNDQNWWYLDSSKGYAVVRHDEVWGTIPGQSEPYDIHVRTVLQEDFHQTDSGFWYPRQTRSRYWGAKQKGEFVFDPDSLPIAGRLHIAPADPNWPDSLFQVPVATR